MALRCRDSTNSGRQVVYPLVLRLSRLMAILGGIVLSVLVLMVCLSIVGRVLNGMMHDGFASQLAPGFARWAIDAGVGPINGDYELVEAGMAFVVFAFLPYTQLTAGHATVDVFTKGLSAGTNRALLAIGDNLFAIVLVIITLQLFGGMQSKINSGQTTFLLEFPLWWAYALSLVGAVIATLASLYVAIARIKEITTGETVLPIGSEP